MSRGSRLKKPRTFHKTVEGRQIIWQGRMAPAWQDIYHFCLTTSWTRFFVMVTVVFVLLNMFFATLYWLQPNSIANLFPVGILGAFFFSLETLATVGYGEMHPQTLYGHIISALEIALGIVNAAVLTGLIFARFSKPKARILFSNKLAISDFNGLPTLMLRIANTRRNMIVAANAKMHIMMREEARDGTFSVDIADAL